MAQAKSQKLSNAYLIVGEDALKRRTVLERLRKRVAQAGSLDFNHDEFDGETANGSQIAISCNTLPFASDLRLVEVSNVDKLAKAESDVLVAYLAAPCESTVLALSGEKLAKNTRLYKAVAALGASCVIDCTPVKRYELARNVRSMAVSRGFAMNEQAAEALIELVGEDTVRLDNELRKLALAHVGKDPMGERELRSLVARTSEAKPWELVDAMAARDLKLCMLKLSRLDTASPYVLIAMCTTRLRELLCAKSLASRHESPSLAQVLGVPAWRVKNHGLWARRYSEHELRHAFSTARDCERAMKSGIDPSSAFEEWLVSVVVAAR